MTASAGKKRRALPARVPRREAPWQLPNATGAGTRCTDARRGRGCGTPGGEDGGRLANRQRKAATENTFGGDVAGHDKQLIEAVIRVVNVPFGRGEGVLTDDDDVGGYGYRNGILGHELAYDGGGLLFKVPPERVTEF